MKKEVVKRAIGRPKKEHEVVLLIIGLQLKHKLLGEKMYKQLIKNSLA
jgi:hypothetical protein